MSLARLVNWLGDDLIVHGLVAAAKTFWENGGAEATARVGVRRMEKFGREGQLEAAVLDLLSSKPRNWKPSKKQIESAKRRRTRFYKSLSTKRQDQWEKLRGDVWSVVQDDFGSGKPSELKTFFNPKGQKTHTSEKQASYDARAVFDRYLVLFGLLTPAGKTLHIQELYQASLTNRIQTAVGSANGTAQTQNQHLEARLADLLKGGTP